MKVNFDGLDIVFVGGVMYLAAFGDLTALNAAGLLINQQTS